MILIPARNESPRISAVIQAVRGACPGVEVVVVVNGCTDDTAAVARKAGATVIESELGYGAALLAGYRYAAVRTDLPWLVQLDADGQHPAEAIPDLVAALVGADVVVGSRFAEGGSAPGWPLHRRWTVRAMGNITRWLSGLRVLDVSSGFQAFRPEVVLALCGEFDPLLTDANVLVRLNRKGFKVEEVGVSMAKRSGGQSMHGGIRSAVYAGKTLVAVGQEIRG